MDLPLFHIHVDGAILPSSLETYSKAKYGFFNDDFDHRLVVETSDDPGMDSVQETLPGRQLTLKLSERAQVRGICEDLRDRATAEGFAGMIQSEFVMSELLLQSQYTQYQPTPFPFFVRSRKIDPGAGEQFKSHELHLEFSTDGADARLILNLARSGMTVAFAAREVTFTASGNLNSIRRIQAGLLEYLKAARGFDRAKLITEATVFHSLHRMRPENTPAVIQKIVMTGAETAIPAAASAAIA